jgi:N-methylhydantoinase B/oxoprolinase/acetone carboxylase alpha subunit
VLNGNNRAERAREDVLNELVSREAAERDYGVVLTADGAVEELAISHRRSQGA